MSNKKNVTCQEVMDHICESLGENLDSPKCRSIKQHLDECPGCQNYFKSIEITIDCYRKYDATMPKDAHKKLMDFLDLED